MCIGMLRGMVVRLGLAAGVMAWCAPALGQQTAFAALGWNGVTAGPRAQDYPTALDERDLYVLEDFRTDAPWLVGRFSCVGAAPRGGTTGVAAFILDGLPPAGRVVMQSTVAGTYVDAFPWGRYETDFGGQRLNAGSYWIMWAAQGNPDVILPVMFVRDGAHTVGHGEPNNAYQYNPGLWWNLPGGALDPVNAGFNNEGPQIGVNFTLSGTPAPNCPGDFNGDGAVNTQDFFEFLDAFFGERPSADFNDDGVVNSQDFFAFVTVFLISNC